MPKTKRYVDCPTHGTQEASRGEEDPIAAQAVLDKQGPYTPYRLPFGTMFCRKCLAVLPYREMRLKEGRKTEKCGTLCWHAKREICNCICNGKAHGLGVDPEIKGE